MLPNGNKCWPTTTIRCPILIVSCLTSLRGLPLLPDLHGNFCISSVSLRSLTRCHYYCMRRFSYLFVN